MKLVKRCKQASLRFSAPKAGSRCIVVLALASLYVAVNSDDSICLSKPSEAMNTEVSRDSFGDQDVQHLPEGHTLKIFDGEDAPKGRFPYMTSLRNHWRAHACTAILVDPWFVLTAAHCISSSSGGPNARVYIGGYSSDDTEKEGAKVMRVKESIVHPNYTGGEKPIWDVALLRLPRKVRNIPTPILAQMGGEYTHGRVTALGWGSMGSSQRKQSTILQMTNTLEVAPNNMCESYPDIQGHQLCLYAPEKPGNAASGNTCQGDSGGPVLLPDNIYDPIKGDPNSDIILGITSYGEQCDKPGSMGVYVRVDHVSTWVNEEIKAAIITYDWQDYLSDIFADLRNWWAYSSKRGAIPLATILVVVFTAFLVYIRKQIYTKCKQLLKTLKQVLKRWHHENTSQQNRQIEQSTISGSKTSAEGQLEQVIKPSPGNYQRVPSNSQRNSLLYELKHKLSESLGSENAETLANELHERFIDVFISLPKRSQKIDGSMQPIIVSMNDLMQRSKLVDISSNLPLLNILARLYRLVVELFWYECTKTLEIDGEFWKTQKDIVEKAIENARSLSSAMEGDNAVDLKFELWCVKQAAVCLPTEHCTWPGCLIEFDRSGPDKFLRSVSAVHKNHADRLYLEVFELRGLGIFVKTEDDFEKYIQPHIKSCQKKGGNLSICLAITLMNIIEKADASLRHRVFKGKDDKPGLVDIIEWESKFTSGFSGNSSYKDTRRLVAQYLWKLAVSGKSKYEELQKDSIHALRLRCQSVHTALSAEDNKWLESQLWGLEKDKEIVVSNALRAQELLATKSKRKWGSRR